MPWANSAVAITALRTMLSDNPTDKYAYRKKVFGPLNGINVNFKTFEYKRITNFTAISTVGFGVYKNDTLLAMSAIASDDTQEGEFLLNTPPIDGDTLTASYYYQWFIDSDLDQFLQNASNWLGLGSSYTNVPDGLIPAALRYAAGESYEKLYMRWSVRSNQTFMLEDSPDDNVMKMVESFQRMSAEFNKKAKDHRDDFYKRQGQTNAPLYGYALGGMRDVVPNR